MNRLVEVIVSEELIVSQMHDCPLPAFDKRTFTNIQARPQTERKRTLPIFFRSTSDLETLVSPSNFDCEVAVNKTNG